MRSAGAGIISITVAQNLFFYKLSNSDKARIRKKYQEVSLERYLFGSELCLSIVGLDGIIAYRGE